MGGGGGGGVSTRKGSGRTRGSPFRPPHGSGKVTAGLPLSERQGRTARSGHSGDQ